jgi:3-oxoacyl-[acyl-carrier protein] reductase
MPDPGALLAGRVALVTGANHGIGAATARALAAAGAAVALAWWALDDPAEDGTPAAYAEQRAAGAEPVVDAIRAGSGRAVTVEADLRSTDAPARLFDAAEAAFGPVDVLVNNASGWAQDSSSGAAADHVGRRQHPVTASIDRNLEVDARAPALLIAELARRHVVRGATRGRIVGLTSGGRDGFPGEVSYGAAKAARRASRWPPPWSWHPTASRPTWCTRR